MDTVASPHVRVGGARDIFDLAKRQGQFLLRYWPSPPDHSEFQRAFCRGCRGTGRLHRNKNWWQKWQKDPLGGLPGPACYFCLGIGVVPIGDLQGYLLARTPPALIRSPPPSTPTPTPTPPPTSLDRPHPPHPKRLHFRPHLYLSKFPLSLCTFTSSHLSLTHSHILQIPGTPVPLPPPQSPWRSPDETETPPPPFTKRKSITVSTPHPPPPPPTPLKETSIPSIPFPQPQPPIPLFSMDPTLAFVDRLATKSKNRQTSPPSRSNLAPSPSQSTLEQSIPFDASSEREKYEPRPWGSEVSPPREGGGSARGRQYLESRGGHRAGSRMGSPAGSPRAGGGGEGGGYRSPRKERSRIREKAEREAVERARRAIRMSTSPRKGGKGGKQGSPPTGQPTGQSQTEGRQRIGPPKRRDILGEPPISQLLEWFRSVKPSLEPIKDKVGEISKAIHVARPNLDGTKKGARIPYGGRVVDKVLGLGDVALAVDEDGREGLRGENPVQGGRVGGDWHRGMFGNRHLVSGKSRVSANEMVSKSELGQHVVTDQARS